MSAPNPVEMLEDIIFRYGPVNMLASLTMEAQGSVVPTALPMQVELAQSLTYLFDDLEALRNGMVNVRTEGQAGEQ